MEAVANDLKFSRVPVAQEPRASAVQMQHVDYFWPKVSDWIERALAEAVQHELNAQEIYRRCKSGEYLMLLLAIGEDLCGVAVLEKSVNSRGQLYLIVAAAGGVRMPEWIGTLVAACKVIANEQGARELMMIGRAGWRPYLQAQGARVKCICMTMEV